MERMKDVAFDLAENYQKEHPEASWEEAMMYVCEEKRVFNYEKAVGLEVK